MSYRLDVAGGRGSRLSIRRAGEARPLRVSFTHDHDKSGSIRGFVVNALVKDPGEQTPIHDHAHTWTLYGVLEGGEKVTRYRRADDGD